MKVPQIRGTIPNFGGLASGFSSVPSRKAGKLTPASAANSKLWKLRTRMIPDVVRARITADKYRPISTADSQNARNREWPDQRSASRRSMGEPSPVKVGEDKDRFLTPPWWRL